MLNDAWKGSIHTSIVVNVRPKALYTDILITF